MKLIDADEKRVHEQPIILNEEKLKSVLAEYFDVHGDTYAYNLTRVKTAFEIGTMTMDDFEEFNEETIDDIAGYIMKNITIESNFKLQKQNI